jgi:hypothetical protein
MMAFYFYWEPPKLSQQERLALGQAIAAVGRKAFAKALWARLVDIRAERRSFSYADVLNDVTAKPIAPASPWKARIGGIAFFGGGLVLLIATGLIFVFLMALVLGGGTALWVYRRVDRWTQSIVDEYAGSVARI